MVYNIISLLALLCIIYNPMHATLTHTNDRDVLHLRYTVPTMPIQDQLPEASNNRSLVPYDQDQYDADCLPLCFVLTGECAGTTLGYPNLGAALGIASGLMHEFLQCMYD